MGAPSIPSLNEIYQGTEPFPEAQQVEVASQMPEIIAQAGTGVGKGLTFPFHQMRPDLSGEMISRAEAYDQPTMNNGQMFDHLSDEVSKVAPFEGDKAITRLERSPAN